MLWLVPEIIFINVVVTKGVWSCQPWSDSTNSLCYISGCFGGLYIQLFMLYEVVDLLAMPLSTMHMTQCTRVKQGRVVSWVLLCYYCNLSKICPWVMNLSGSIDPQWGGGHIFDKLQSIGLLLWQLISNYQGCLGSHGTSKHGDLLEVQTFQSNQWTQITKSYITYNH